MSISEKVNVFSSNQENKKRPKIKALSAEIIVSGAKEHPYYEIKYYDLADRQIHIGYSSYELNNVFEWMEECFEIVKESERDIISEQVNELRAVSRGCEPTYGGNHMDERIMQILREIQFEKCKGELRVLVAMFDFYPTYDGTGYDSTSREKREVRENVEYCIENFINSMEDYF